MEKNGMHIFTMVALFGAVMGGIARGQIYESFSDGNFTHDPVWRGDTGRFVVTASSAVPADLRPALQLNGSGGDTSCLYTSQTIARPWEWSFWIKLSFNSSANNFARVFLGSENDDLHETPAGYYLEIGGADDSVRLCRSGGPGPVILFTAEHAVASGSTNAFFFKVTYDPDHRWSLFSSRENPASLLPEGSAVDTVKVEIRHFGLFFKYTSSNATKFYFDELYSGEMQIDTLAPGLQHIRSLGHHQLELSFTEAIDTNDLQERVRCVIEENNDTCRLLPGKNGQRLLALTNHALTAGKSYTLFVEGICDASGNCADPAGHYFVHYLPGRFDLCITEVLPDPFPSAGLPPVEYLELLNNGEYLVFTEDMKLLIEDTEWVLSEHYIRPGEYLVFCNELDTGEMEINGRVAGIPGLSLPNNRGVIILKDCTGKVMAGTEYAYATRKDPKSEGGWSLEMIDPRKACLKDENWTFSTDVSGGTPGKENSVNGLMEFPTPLIDKICVTGPREILVTFSTMMDSSSAAGTASYSIGEGPVPIERVEINDGLFREALIFTEQELERHRIYELETTGNIMNGCGAAMGPQPVRLLGRPSAPRAKDIVINEVLFNPLGDGADYVEVYNRSSAVFDLQELLIGSVKVSPPSPPDTTVRKVSPACRQFLPGEYAVLTKDPSKVLEQYFTNDPAAMIETDLPSLKNEGGEVLLISQDGEIVDRLQFSEDMHFPLLRSVEGVSLELIHYDRTGGLGDDWHSASEPSGFGTPGVINSQFSLFMAADDPVEVRPVVFSPDGDGYNDVLSIHYSFGLPGISGSVTMFSESGALIRRLVCNDLLGAGGVLYWDGTDEEGHRAPFGIYIVLVEIFDMQGNTKRYKKAVGLTDRRYID